MLVINVLQIKIAYVWSYTANTRKVVPKTKLFKVFFKEINKDNNNNSVSLGNFLNNVKIRCRYTATALTF
jgi:hypothetical protein